MKKRRGPCSLAPCSARTISSCLGDIFGSPPISNRGGSNGSSFDFGGARALSEGEWPSHLEALPYRWVPARRGSEALADPTAASSMCEVLYDHESNGVGQLDASRVLSDPSIALEAMRKSLASYSLPEPVAAAPAAFEEAFRACASRLAGAPSAPQAEVRQHV